MQIDLNAIRQFDEAKTLAGIEPDHLRVDGVCRYGRRALKVARFGVAFRKGNRIIVIPTPAWLTLVSILSHDSLGWHGELATLRIISVRRRVCVK